MSTTSQALDDSRPRDRIDERTHRWQPTDGRLLEVEGLQVGESEGIIIINGHTVCDIAMHCSATPMAMTK